MKSSSHRAELANADPGAEPVLNVHRLSKSFGRRRVVNDVSFAVGAGEVLGLLGPNGSGKSTILRIITGYLQASAGRVQVSGFDVARQGIEARRRIGYVPEDAPLYDHMRVVESLSFMGRLKGLRGDALTDAVDDACARLALGAVRGQSVAELSRGYRQRVAIAQALLGGPDLLVLDEPTNGLDPRQIIELRELIGALSRHLTLLITSHILAEMERVATRVAILLDGRLLAVGPIAHTGVPRVEVQVRGCAAAALTTVLTAIDGVAIVNAPTPIDGDRLAVIVEVSGPDALARIAPALVAGDISLVSLRDVATDLESIFLSLTERDEE